MQRWLLPLLLAAIVLGGCLGSSPSTPQASTDVIQITTAAATKEPEVPKDVFVPKFHGHDYWNGRTEVSLFAGDLKLGDDPRREFKTRGNMTIIGFKEFSPKSDGDDVGSADKTDTVYQGTKEILVKLEWSTEPSTQIKGLSLSYKTAAGPLYYVIQNVPNGKEFSIPVKKGWADMPHQIELSRWRFVLDAYDPAQDSLPQKVYAAKGNVKVNMRIINGGEQAIDPPHPYFFTAGPVRYAGEVNQTVASTVYANASAADQELQHAVGGTMSGWKIGNRLIIPWETTKLQVWLNYNYTGKASPLDHTLGLKYSDASGPDEKTVKAVNAQPGSAYYEFEVDEAMTDSPYAQASDWTWGVYPLVQGQANPGADFEGNVHIYVQAVQEGDTSGRGGGI